MSSETKTTDAWVRFINTGIIDTTALKPMIAQSWLRCKEYGVDPQGGNSDEIIIGKELENLLASNSQLIRIAKPFMKNLYKFVEKSNFLVGLTDKNGIMLEVIASHKVLESSKGMHYVRGMTWREDLVGTTAITLALSRCEPVQVVGGEHFCKEHQDWTCSAAPLTDASGKIIGVLNVAGPQELAHCHTLGMVISAAVAINNMLKVCKKQKELEMSEQLYSTIVNSVRDGLLMLDKDGMVIFINPIGARILHINAEEAVGKYIGSLVDFKPIVVEVLETGQGYTDRECVIKTKRGMLHFVKTAVPLKDDKGQLQGVVDVFREIKQVRRLVNHMVGATASFTFDDIIGNSTAIGESIRLGKIAANSFANVLIQGDSGTGKELIAQAIHKCSCRSDEPFVAINCGALPRNLVESELFGYEEGAFTGAKHGGRPGKFELAHGGTIFLDEIGDMPLDIQVRLLRVLQEKKIIRIGGQQYIDIDVRIIAATNKDLNREVHEGNFRLDLYYRLNVLPIIVPPLRERREDIPLLVEFFLHKLCKQAGISQKIFSPQVYKAFMNYDWPGNVRELENVIERAVNLCEQESIGMEFLPRGFNKKETVQQNSQLNLRVIEKTAIEQTLEKTQGNVSMAAKLLGIGRNTLYSKVKQYDLCVPKYGCSGIGH